MNLDELKSAWLEYDSKLQSSQLLNQKIISSMIGERSKSRVARVQRHYRVGGALTLFWLVLSIAVLAGNPFDYTKLVEYAPVFLLAICFVSILVLIARASLELRNTNLNQANLVQALEQIIAVYNKPRQFLKWTVIAMFSSSLLFPLSFLPRKLAHTAILPALIDTLIPMAICLTLYFIAHKLGAFKDANGARFQEDLDELLELRKIPEEMK